MASDPFDYIGTRSDADELIADFGQNVTVRRTVKTAGANDWTPTVTTQDFVTQACILALTRWYPPTVTATDILRTDKRGIVAAGPLAALGTDAEKFDALITADGTIYRVLDCKPIAPAGIACAYDCWLRI